MFWSSDKLTGNQTLDFGQSCNTGFWSSDKLTGSQTAHAVRFFSRVAQSLAALSDAALACLYCSVDIVFGKGFLK